MAIHSILSTLCIPARHLYDGRLSGKVVSEKVDVDCGRHENDFELRALQNEAPDGPKQEVAMQMSLVNLVQDDDVIATQGGVWGGLGMVPDAKFSFAYFFKF